MIVTELSSANQADWDAYVEQAPGGLPLHLAGWRAVLEESYGYRTAFLLAQEGERPAGVLPLFLVRSRLLGSTATTMPGGLCADSPAVASALIERGLEQARNWGADRFRLHDTRCVWPGRLQTVTHHEQWEVAVAPNAQAQWRTLDSNMRRQVRIARRAGLRAEVDHDGRARHAFYEVFSRFARQAGTPIFGRDFLENVVCAFPGRVHIVVVWKELEPIAAYFQLEWRRRMLGLWGAALHEHLALRPAHLAIWTILEDAAGRGISCLNMGRSPAGSGASRFKEQWGGVRAPVYQQVVALKRAADRDPLANGIQSERKMQLFMGLWARLPLPLTRVIGPYIRRHMPFA